MFPHQNNIRERRVGQPPMAPQHLMGMPQQGPGMKNGQKKVAIMVLVTLAQCLSIDAKILNFDGMTAKEFTSMFGRNGCIQGVIMSMPPPVPIMTQNHFTNQNYSTQGQTNVSSYVPSQQLPPTKSNYHQAGYSHNNPQVILTKQTNNRNKNYRKEYNVIKDPSGYSDQSNQQNNFSTNENNSFSGYPGNYNGHYTSGSKEGGSKTNGSHDTRTNPLKDSDDTNKKEATKNSEAQAECPAVPPTLVSGSKEKTPMCLVNELARFNKITHQYRLTNEQGPAHKKSFTVTLTLGTEEYTAEGPSIKKAQHSAAAEALTKTSFPHPMPKTNKNLHSGKSNITPTVELNALAMKRGEPAIYKLLEPSQNPQMFQPGSSYGMRRPYGIHHGFGKRGRNNFFSRGIRMPYKPAFTQNMLYMVSLKVGSWEFFGEGISPQSARHDAASKALSQLRSLPVPEVNTCSIQKDNTALHDNQESDSSNKSPISLVHEIALKRNMNVAFEVISDRGPPHMKVFVTKCTVGELTATGEGNGKKISKKRAAENMLIELKKLPPLSPSFAMSSMSISRMKRKFTQTKKKSKNLIKIVQDNKNEPELGEEINPISRLIQIQQMKKEKEPFYVLLEERSNSRKKEFLMEASVGQLKATGSGPNKKLAKKAAARNLLSQMGYGKPDNPSKPALKAQDGTQDPGKDRKVTFVETEKAAENNTGGSAGRQLKPGIYVMSCDQHCSSTNPVSTPINMQTTATIAKELLKGGNSPTADALVQKSTLTKGTLQTGSSQSFRPKDQLLYLANLLNFQVHFSDFPKGNHSEFLSLVTMSTDPSHVCHGSGPTVEESQDQAALTALRALSEMGLDSVTSQNSTKDNKKNSKGMSSLKK